MSKEANNFLFHHRTRQVLVKAQNLWSFFRSFENTSAYCSSENQLPKKLLSARLTECWTVVEHFENQLGKTFGGILYVNFLSWKFLATKICCPSRILNFLFKL